MDFMTFKEVFYGVKEVMQTAFYLAGAACLSGAAFLAWKKIFKSK